MARKRKVRLKFQIVKSAGTYFAYDENAKKLAMKRDDGLNRTDVQIAELLLGKTPKEVQRKNGIIHGVYES